MNEILSSVEILITNTSINKSKIMPLQCLNENQCLSFKQQIISCLKIQCDEKNYYLEANNKIIENFEQLLDLITKQDKFSPGKQIFIQLKIQFRCLGGKGGFGHLLRSQVSRSKIKNWDASRDLQGRRIRHSKDENRIVEHYRQERLRREEQKKELEEIKNQEKEQKLAQKEIKLDQKYIQKLEKWDNIIQHSVVQNQSKKIQKTKDVHFNDSIVNEKNNYSKEQNEPIVIQTIKNILNEETKIQVEQNNSSIVNEQLPQVENNINNNEKKNKIQQQQQFEQIDLEKNYSVDDLIALGGDHLKYELMRLGLKCGGTIQERAKRLFDVKLNPKNLFNPKYLVQKK